MSEANEPATKADISRLDAKIDKVALELSKAIYKVDGRIDGLKAEMGANTDRILGAIDAVLQRGQTYDQKALSHGGMLVDHTAKLKEHEGRLKTLEAKP